MFGKREDFFPQSKVTINPSYVWDERAKSLNVSHRELEIFALFMDGHDNKKTAQILGIQYQSVKNHMYHLGKKFGVKNNAQILLVALKLNMLKTIGLNRE